MSPIPLAAWRCRRLLLGALVWLDVLEPIFLVAAVIIAIVIGVFMGVASDARGGSIVSKLFTAVWVTVVGVNIFGSSLSFASGIKIDTGLIAAVSILVIELIFAILMRAPTIQGRKLMDEIEGFKMYLETAEKNRLNFVGEPPMTVKRFESILPFAIALASKSPGRSVSRPTSRAMPSPTSRTAATRPTGTTAPTGPPPPRAFPTPSPPWPAPA